MFHSITSLLASLTVSVSLGLLASGCSMGPPKRAPYLGQDTVAELRPDMLIGSWNVRVLNPVEGEEDSRADARFDSDGTVVMNSSSTREDMSLAMRMTGRWRIEGDLVFLTMETIEETSGNAMAALMMPMLNSLKDSASDSANVYESSENRLLLVTTEGGQAQEFTRR